MERLHTFVFWGMVIAMTTGCDPTMPIGVTEGGVCVDVGKTIPREDECNTCTCESSHVWTCTHNLCECTPGTSKPADDGCNVCSCTASGRWVCTLMACVVDPCADGKKSYAATRERLVTKTSTFVCGTNADCAMVYENNRCVANCGAAWPAIIAQSVSQTLESSANTNCATCPPVVVPPCLPMVAQCVEGACVLGSARP